MLIDGSPTLLLLRLTAYLADVGFAFNVSAVANGKAIISPSPSFLLLWADASCVACPRLADRWVSPGGAIAAEDIFGLMRGLTHKNASGQKLSPFELGSQKDVRV